MGEITFDGRGPYDLPDATHADAQKDGDGFMLSFRMWKSDTEWTLVRIHVSAGEAEGLAQHADYLLGHHLDQQRHATNLGFLRQAINAFLSWSLLPQRCRSLL